MLVWLISSASMVLQKAQYDRAPAAVVVSPTLVRGSSGTVLANQRWDQNKVMFLLVVSAPVPSSLG